MKKNERAVYISIEQWEALREIAFKQKKTRSALVREAIKKVYKV